MSHADLRSTKQNIIRVGRCVVEVATACDGSYADHDAAFLLGDAVSRLSKLVQDYRDKPKSLGSQEKAQSLDVDFRIPRENENDRCVRLLARILGKIQDRWQQEQREFFSALKDYYDGWILDEEGEPIEGPPDRTELPCVEESRVALSLEEIGGLRAVIARFETAEDTSGSEPVQIQTPNTITNNDMSTPCKIGRSEERDEWIYDKYVEGEKELVIAMISNKKGWTELNSGAAVRRGARHSLHGQGVGCYLADGSLWLLALRFATWAGLQKWVKTQLRSGGNFTPA